MRIALLTSAELPDGIPGNRLLQDELRRRGVDADFVVWEHTSGAQLVDDGVVAAVVTSTWDYFEKLPAFLTFVDDVAAAGVRLLNSADVIRWNSNKRYLQQLIDAGASVLPTVFVDDGRSLDDVAAAHNWRGRLVQKPVVSAGAFETFVVDEDDPRRATPLPAGTMVQPFFEEVLSGELSVLVFGGELSHVVQKTPKAGDFRVQSDFGGVTTEVRVDDAVLQTALDVLDCLPHTTCGIRVDDLAYARIDGLVVDGVFQLMELELIEPERFLDVVDGAAQKQADALLRLFDTST